MLAKIRDLPVRKGDFISSFVQHIFMRLIFIITFLILIIFIRGCIESYPKEPKTEIHNLSEENKTDINTTPEEREGTIPATAPKQINSKLIMWTKENGIRTSGVSSSTIIKDNKYWMYYTWDGIELATSSDGLNFANRENVIKNGPIGSEKEMITNPTVFRLLDGRYRMIYEGSKWAEDETGERYQTNRKLYSAVSTDGKKWTKEDGVRFWDNGDGKPGEIFTSVPDVIRLDDGRLRMYYTRGATSATALSSDEGLTWAKETDIELRKVAIDPDIVRLDGNSYKLFFTTFADEFGFGEQWIMSAGSTDGVNFVIDEGKIIEPSTSGGLVTDPDVIKTDNGYRMYYGEFKKGEYESNIMSAFSSG